MSAANAIENFDHLHLLFPSNYLKAGDLRGRDVTVTIAKVEPRHELRKSDGKNEEVEELPVVYFKEGSGKGLVLNKTNATSIAKLHGNRPSQWVGKQITLFATEVRAFGDVHECIRIRGKGRK